jgi:hypothetical protein
MQSDAASNGRDGDKERDRNQPRRIKAESGFNQPWRALKRFLTLLMT